MVTRIGSARHHVSIRSLACVVTQLAVVEQVLPCAGRRFYALEQAAQHGGRSEQAVRCLPETVSCTLESVPIYLFAWARSYFETGHSSVYFFETGAPQALHACVSAFVIAQTRRARSPLAPASSFTKASFQSMCSVLIP